MMTCDRERCAAMVTAALGSPNLRFFVVESRMPQIEVFPDISSDISSEVFSEISSDISSDIFARIFSDIVS